ncbi:MAG: DUF5654 family protein, partial [Vulcanimicrobiaceae bacterium]
LATVAFGLLAAGAWNAAIAALLKVFLGPGNGVLGAFIYAILVTILAIWVINSLGKLADKDSVAIK